MFLHIYITHSHDDQSRSFTTQSSAPGGEGPCAPLWQINSISLIRWPARGFEISPGTDEIKPLVLLEAVQLDQFVYPITLQSGGDFVSCGYRSGVLRTQEIGHDS